LLYTLSLHDALPISYATTTTPGVVQLATNAETQAGTDTTKVITPANLSSRTATETRSGIAEVATQAETNTGTDDTTIVTPLKLTTFLSSVGVPASSVNLTPTINGWTNAQQALQDAVYDITSTGLTILPTETATGKFNLEVAQATEAQLGGAQIATQAETNNGVLDTVVITPLKLNARVASETLSGIAEIATQAETNALADDTKIITPLKLGALFSSGSIDATDIVLNPNINGNANVQTALQDAVYDITSTGLSITITTAATGKFNVEVTQATETQIGGAEVATQVETEAGALDTRMVTPLKLRTATIYKSDFNAKGDLLSATANDTPSILTVGTNGQYLRADSTQPTGLVWDTVSASDITVSPAINGNTDLDTILRDAIYDVTSANTSITVSIAATGLVTLTAVDATTAQKGVVELATAAEVVTGTSTTLVATADGVRTAAIYKSDLNAKGDLISATANDTPAILSVGIDGQILTADSTAASGLKWASAGSVSFSFVNLDDVSASFNGAATSFPLTIGGVPYTPSPLTNIMVFVGGVAQVPGAGNAYIVVGSNISFSSAPPTGATFYATTVK